MVRYFIPVIPPGRYEMINDKSETNCRLTAIIVNIVLWRLIAKNNVATSDPTYIRVNTTLDDEVR